MKRNMDLVRDLLFAIEALEPLGAEVDLMDLRLPKQGVPFFSEAFLDLGHVLGHLQNRADPHLGQDVDEGRLAELFHGLVAVSVRSLHST